MTPAEELEGSRFSFVSADCSKGGNVCQHSSVAEHRDKSDPEPNRSSRIKSLFDIPKLGDTADACFSFLDVLSTVLQVSDAACVGLKQFIRLSMQPQSRTVHRVRVSNSDIWPCPIPLWSWTASPNPSPRRRRRRHRLKLRSQVLQHIVGVLNWECLGHPLKPPPHACAGYEFSESQVEMLCRLEHLIDHFLSADDVSASSLGRSWEKFSKLLAAAKELPEIQDVDLLELVGELAREFDPYSKPQGFKHDGSSNHHTDLEEKLSREASSPQKCRILRRPPTPKMSQNLAPPSPQTRGITRGPGGPNLTEAFWKSSTQKVSCKLPSSVARPVIADRIKWEHSPQFDPIPFFQDQIVKDAFVKPDSVKLPSSEWIRKPKGKVHCSRTELLKLAEKWDSKGACRIFNLSEVNIEETVGMFAVPKDASFDRLILNPQLVNGRMQSFSHYTKELAPGSLFSLIRLKPDEIFRVNADDLAEMYYTIKVPDSRAKRNSIGTIFSSDELSHLSCFDASRHRGRCVVALGALAMGDSWAVEFAQQSHHNVLRFLAGSMLEHQRVAYRRSFPRSDFLEWLSIDDHIGVQILSRAAFRASVRLRDTEVFERAEQAYSQVGLVQHKKKKQRNVTEGVFLGADVDGVKGLVSSPRPRIVVLMLCTALIAQRGSVTPRLLSCILGSWIHVLMFRRPVLSLLSHSFSEGRQCKQDEVFCLGREARNELLALCLMGPVCISDLRVDFASQVFCTDASPAGAGICVAEEDPAVVAELWRHSEQRGYYTELLNPAASILKEHDLEHEDLPVPAVDMLGLDRCLRVPAPLSEGFVYDCLELFRGEGNWSLAHESVGLIVHGGADVKGRRVVFGDLMDNSVYHQLLSLACRRCVRDWHAGTPCLSYGTLRRPRVRSKHKPAGFNMSDDFTRLHTLLALRTAFLMNIVVLSGCYFSVEQPGSSVMFYLDIFKRLVMLGCVITRFCFCSFGSPFKKPSQWLHNKPWMIELESKCSCQNPSSHFVIEGTFTRASIPIFEQMCRPSAEAVYGRSPRVGEAVSSFSGSYPKALCARMASGSLQGKVDSIPVVPLSLNVLSMKRVGIQPEIPKSVLKETQAAARPFHEDPEWVEEYSDSLNFRELLRYKFKKPGHINVLECRVHKTLLKYCAKHHPNCRFLSLLDSRVTLGATSKGRSSSRALCRVLQGSLGYIIGGCLYPGGLHICSSKNKSDAPSRNKKVAPASKDSPSWLIDLRANKFGRFDRVLVASQFTRNPQRWLRFLLLLAGDIERNPGPRARSQKARGPIDLSVGFVPQTSSRMHECLKFFATWLFSTVGANITDLAWDFVAAPLALRAYGMQLFREGSPRYKFVYTITAFQDLFPHMRNHLASAWQVDRKWQQHEPGECRPVISSPIMQAMASLCLIWNWHRWLGITLFGFLGMLHPSEFVNLTRKDILLPQDSLLTGNVFYIHIRNPKTARFARRQHCKIDDFLTLKFAEKVFGDLDPSEVLFAGGMSAYRRRWDAVLNRLGVPTGQKQKGATPAVLRGSGATHMYLQCEDLCRVQWRGRWAQLKTIEHYIQEVAAQTLLHNLDSLAKERIRLFSSCSSLMSEFVGLTKSKD